MEIDLLLRILTVVATSVGAPSLLLTLKRLFDKKENEQETKEVKEGVDKSVSLLLNDQIRQDDDIMSLMLKNVAELKEYYIINKQQARKSFSSALFACILGFMIFCGGIILVYLDSSKNVLPYTTIGGIVIEVISGLFFWLYSKAIKQINIFHSTLLETQKFLTAVHLVDKMSADKKDLTYAFIIKEIINSQSQLNLQELMLQHNNIEKGKSGGENKTVAAQSVNGVDAERSTPEQA